MYLSHLLIDLGGNPDRPRPGRLWLRNIYHVHQRLCMAFPMAEQRAEDPDFLRPFDPQRFQRPKFLFRVDPAVADGGARAHILVQSEIEPDWEYAFKNAPFLAAPPEFRVYEPHLPTGAQLRFRILINLSKKSRREDDVRIKEGIDAAGRPKTQAKRVDWDWQPDEDPEEAVRAWFSGKADRNGFGLLECKLLRLNWVIGDRPKTKSQREESEDNHSGQRMKFRAALLEGALVVADADCFHQAVKTGIGAAKSFGFGLLSVAGI
jgi:CRISPR system Cascade subunit CasE